MQEKMSIWFYRRTIERKLEKCYGTCVALAAILRKRQLVRGVLF